MIKIGSMVDVDGEGTLGFVDEIFEEDGCTAAVVLLQSCEFITVDIETLEEIL